MHLLPLQVVHGYFFLCGFLKRATQRSILQQTFEKMKTMGLGGLHFQAWNLKIE
jgi:hypothetical protein